MTKWNSIILPLLPTFKALLDHRSAVRAGEDLGLTQSAVSKQLAKLRDCFGDELFTRTSSGLQPTERAIQLAPKVIALLEDADGLFRESPFDPARLTGNAVIATTDEIRAQLTVGMLRHVTEHAPNMRLTLIPLEQDYSQRRLENGTVDLVISVNWHAPDHLQQRRLISDRFVCLMGNGHPLARGPLTGADFAAAHHIMVAPLGHEWGVVDVALEQKGLKRFVRLSIPDFLQVSPELLGDDFVISLPHRVALEIAKRGGVTIRELPVEAPAIDYYLFWHQRYRNSRRTIWLRDAVTRAFQ
ncbi:MAG: LysR family transcriptional regulator [Alphaproteobacteria bacterium]